MQTNYYYLKKLSKQIAEKLQVPWSLGFSDEMHLENKASAMYFATCFSQSKDELVLGFCNDTEEFYIKAVLASNFPCLTFPPDFARAKRNSVDLFQELLHLKVLGVVQNMNERSFILQFENEYALLFKIFGRGSNIILFEKEKFVIGFHKKLAQDKEIQLKNLDRLIPQNFEAYEAANQDWKKLFPTFGVEINAYLQSQNINNLNSSEQWQILQSTLHILENPHYTVIHAKDDIALSILPLLEKQSLISECADALTVANEFYYHYTKISALDRERKVATKDLQKKIKQTQAYLDKNMERLMELSDSSLNEEIANIIMANLHQIPKGTSSVELFDFYRDENRIIKLKKELSPQKNAENYYRKAKNEKIELDTLQKNLERKEQELIELQGHLSNLEKMDNVRDLRKYLRENSLSKPKNNQAESPKDTLFKKFEYKGFEIWVGKNAKNNDLLTQKYAFKEDLWLHAKDVSGSHVIIKYQAGKTFPSDVIEKAAALAAYYSKRSNDSFCPVIYTPRKFVRKTKDLADGQVIVEKEEVVMVVPEKF